MLLCEKNLIQQELHSIKSVST